MPETLATVDGEELALDAELSSEAVFAAAMAAPAADKPGMAAPARKPPEPAPDPENAPHGWTFVGGEWRPKKSPGRPRRDRDEKPRVSDAPPAPSPPAAAGKGSAGSGDRAAVDYRRPLKEAVEALWFGLAAAPVPDAAFGMTGLRTRLRVQAHLLERNVDALAAGINNIGQHNRFVRAGLARLKAGEGGLWVLPTMLLLAPFATQTAQLWGGQLADAATLEAIAEQTEQQLAVYLQKLTGDALDEANAAAAAAQAAAAEA